MAVKFQCLEQRRIFGHGTGGILTIPKHPTIIPHKSCPTPANTISPHGADHAEMDSTTLSRGRHNSSRSATDIVPTYH